MSDFPPASGDDQSPGARGGSQTAREGGEARRGPGRGSQSPPRHVRRRDETSMRGGVLGITAVGLATLAISLVGALISFVVSLLY